MKKQQTALYILITYCVMQLSGIIFASLLFMAFKYYNLENPMLLANGWWTFIGMGTATIITLLIIRKDKSFIRPLKGQASSTLKSVAWGVLGFIMVLYGQALAANIEIKFFGIEPGSENTQDFMELASSVPFVFSLSYSLPQS